MIGFKQMLFKFITVSILIWSGIEMIHAQGDYLKFDNFKVEQGLSNNMVYCAYQDSKGWMWFGTAEGLNRFDGYKFICYLPVNKDTTSIKGTLIRSIVEDSKGFLWLGADNGGLNKFDRKKNIFKRYLQKESIKCLKIQGDSVIWVGTKYGLYKLGIQNEKLIKFTHNPSDKNSLTNDYVRFLELDKKGNLWIGTGQGLDLLNLKSNKFQHIKYDSQLSDDEIQHIYIDGDGSVWLGTFNNGFFIYNPETKSSEQFVPDKSNDRSFTVRKVIRDCNGIYWIATRGGLYLFNRSKNHFSSYFNSDRDPNSLCSNSILDISADHNGDIWIGTRGGISYMARDKQVFKLYKSFVNDNRFLNNNEIYAFWLEKNGNLWIGTENGGINILNQHTGIYSYITRSNDKLQSNTIKAFADDGKGNLWVASFLGGLNIVDINTKRVKKIFLHNPDDPGSISDNRVWSVHFDFYGNLWIGTDKGIDRFDFSTGKFVHYSYLTNGAAVLWINEDKDHDLWISTNKKIFIYNTQSLQIKTYNIPGRVLYVDSKGRCWLTTYYKGLVLMDKHNGPVKIYTEKDGIADNRTYCIFEDKSGYLWISTSDGLSKFDPEKEKFINYDISDGLLNNQFNYGAGIELPSGDFIFGGVDGFTVFNPQDVKMKKYDSPLVFTDFRIFYKPVPISDEKNAILHEDISEASSVTIPHDKNVFLIEFASLNYAKSKKNRYAYQLMGFDKDWNFAGEQHSAIYTNLDPGKYLFRVKTISNDNVENNKVIELNIRILPPFWSTVWFKVLLVVLMLFIVYSLVNFITYRNHLKQEVIMERARARQIHELDLMKMKFFTNISHEIRTPLTLIIGPVEKMLQETLSEKETKSNLSIIHRNAEHLLRLVNQLLDFRKIETGNLKLELKRGDIVAFVSSIVGTFQQLATDKGIQLRISAVQKEIFSFFDPDKVEKIVDNLLSNALKFTNRGGMVNVSISLVMDSSEESSGTTENKFIEIVVKDTGIGISESNLEKIFHRFFQSNDNTNQTGTGIGLSLTKELVKLHRGRINVESKHEKGTRFIIMLPFIVENEELAMQPQEIASAENNPESISELKEQDENASDKILLIVEDNIDVRYFIRSHFEPDYRVLEASDGKEGIAVALKNIPDVIITDILMPGIDGIELLKKIKKDERTSHIPIILLTALTSKESIHQGLVAGADDYITKPFDILLLRTKVDNLFMLRKSLQMKYSGELMLQPKNIKLTSPDEKFLKKAIEIVEKFIDDADLDSDKFAQHLGVSRMQLYRKLGALTDMTVKDFIRDLRLKRAAQLLVQNKMNISEVAYSVGFKDLSHFRRCFRQEFGITASDYIKKFGEVS
jgi:signal transduction histidine kinase/ligand-binding sensor domain-containing protein/DNA-binding response OmpR family regulator